MSTSNSATISPSVVDMIACGNFFGGFPLNMHANLRDSCVGRAKYQLLSCLSACSFVMFKDSINLAAFLTIAESSTSIFVLINGSSGRF